MKSLTAPIILALTALLCLSGTVSASVFMPKTMQVKQTAGAFTTSSSSALLDSRKDLRRAVRQQGFHRRNSAKTAMAIPGYGVAEQVFVGGFGNFLSIVS